VPRLTADEAAAFLDEPGHLLRVATVDADGMPRNVPVWFIRRAGRILFTPRARSAFLANLVRDPRVGVTIDEAVLPYRKVAVQARVELVHPPGEDDEWRELYREIAYRYIDRPQADAYVDSTIDQPRALVAVPTSGDTARLVTWRMPAEGEDPTGIWHRRYYLDETYMARLADGGRP